jgi:hypothetical protein
MSRISSTWFRDTLDYRLTYPVIMSSGQGGSLPLFDAEDARLVGWEIGYAADNGDLAIQVRCHCGCGTVHALRLPPGAFIRCDGPAQSTADGVLFLGPMRPGVQEPPLD